MTDCSGAAASLANFATQGLGAGTGQRFSTGNQGAALKAMGAIPGVGPSGSLSFGWYNGGPYGGHTAATLPDGTNVEMGGAGGNGQFGGSAVGASWSEFTDHMHFPPEFFVGGDELPGTNIGTGYGTYAGADTSGAGTSGGSGAPSGGGSSSGSAPMSIKAYAGQTASSLASEMTGDTLDFFGLGALADAPIFPVQEATADLTISPTAGNGGDSTSTTPATGGNGGPLINLENVETFDLDELVRKLSTELNHLVRSDSFSIGGWSS